MRDKKLLLLILCVTAPLLVRCSVVSLTGGSDNPDFKVVGIITNENGDPAPSAQVTILPSSYDPATDSMPGTAMIDTTDNNGQYRFAVTRQGTYTIQAVHLLRRTRLLLSGVSVKADTTRVTGAALSAPGAIKVALPSNVNSLVGYVYVPGTTILAFLNNRTDFVVLDSVPAGAVPAINYSSLNSDVSSVIRYGVSVASGHTAIVSNPEWKYAHKFTLNTSATGANVAGDIAGFPVLVRLNSGDFDFSQAQATGADIRFTKPDDTPLRYEIERWDTARGAADLWVRVDTVRGNDSAQSITMYWGNPDAPGGSSGAAVFDTAAGFAGVWHLGQSGAAAPDATVNGNDGVATATAAVPGIVGTAQAFDGKSSFIRVSGPSIDKLNFPENGPFSVSAWVKTDVLDSVFHGIVYKSNEQYGLHMRPKNEWEFFTYFDKSRWEMSRSPASDYSWHILTGVRNGSKQYLYVDGVCADTSIAILQTNLARVTDQPLEIGHCPDGGTNPDRYFTGAIDEVRISRTAYSADWIKLCYMNQKERDALVRW